jgi:hypothetical protein
MKKNVLLLLICVVMCGFWGSSALAISETRAASIVENCDTIKEDLKNLQRSDSRARVYLGRYYETILNRFITPLNVRLVENSLSSTGFIDGQNNFYRKRADFIADYIEYQKGLEELVSMDCREGAENFYEKLTSVREKRARVAYDVERLRKLAEEYRGFVNELWSKL